MTWKQFTSSRAGSAWIAAASSAAISLCFVAVLPQKFAVNENADFVSHYDPVARSLLAGVGLFSGIADNDLRQPPGYAIVIAGAFTVAHRTGIAESTALNILAVAAMAASTALVFLIARRIWGEGRAWMAWLAWATYPLALYLLKQPNSEIPFIVVMLMAVYLVSGIVLSRDVAMWRCVACGALAGAAMLTKPIAIGLGLVLALLVVAAGPRRRIALAAALLAANAAIVAPWELSVYRNTGSIVPLSSGGPFTMRDGLTFGVRSKGFRTQTWAPDDVRRVMQRISDQYPRLVSLSAIAQVVGGEFRDHPIAVMKLFALKGVRSWTGTDSHRFDALLALVQSLYLIVLLASAIKAGRLGGAPRSAAIGAWTLAGYFWAMSTITGSIARYMVPVVSLLFVLVPALVHESRE